MQDFLIKEIINSDIENELTQIGFDKTYTTKAADKFEYKNFKIFALTPAQANIIKQTAISVGADCGTHREVITGKIDESSCILGGSISQLKKIGQKLQNQPFKLKELGVQIINLAHNNISAPNTKIVGILNITPDSFSDGGKYLETDKATEQLNNLINDGADIIDIGAETTKPYSNPTPPEVQLERIIPVLNYIRTNNLKTPISIDTRSALVAKKCIEYGISVINDVSGLTYDNEMVNVAADNDVKIIIQHSKDTPDIMQNNTDYANLTDEIFLHLKNRLDFAVSKGVKKENIILDPGIGFGKTREANFEIIRRWKELQTLGCPIMIGLSRKSLLNLNGNNEEKDIYTLALNSILINEGIDYIRVHNVKLHRTLVDMLRNYPLYQFKN